MPRRSVSRVLAGIPLQQRIIVTDAYTAVFLPGQRRAELAGILAHTGPQYFPPLNGVARIEPSGST